MTAGHTVWWFSGRGKPRTKKTISKKNIKNTIFPITSDHFACRPRLATQVVQLTHYTRVRAERGVR